MKEKLPFRKDYSMNQDNTRYLTVKSPCRVDWNTMTGDEKTRFCQQCKLNVHNLSEMNQVEIDKLFESGPGRVCVRFYERADGTVSTRDCKVKLRAMKQALRRSLACVLGMTAWFGIVSPTWAQQASDPKTTTIEGKNLKYSGNTEKQQGFEQETSALKGVNSARACGTSQDYSSNKWLSYLLVGIMIMVFLSGAGGTIYLVKKGSSYLSIGSTLVAITFTLGFLWTIYSGLNRTEQYAVMGEAELTSPVEPTLPSNE